jgi:hypothetical protein
VSSGKNGPTIYRKPFLLLDQSQNVKTYLSEMSLTEHELGNVAEDSAAPSSNSNCGIHYSVSGKVKFSCFITTRFLAKVHIVRICTTVECNLCECRRM